MSEDPHDDRLEVSEEIEKQEGAVIGYEVAEGEDEDDPNENHIEEETTHAMDKRHTDDDDEQEDFGDEE